VDSSVTAALLKEQGYDVVGITLQLYDHGEAVRRKGACCAGQDIHDARKVAADLDMPHYVLDYEGRFKDSVIDDFVDTYLAGATPIPCVRCNERVKFRDLLKTAKDLGADCLATGHYVRREEGAHGAELHMAADPSRDQSYFLFSTSRDQLDYLRFPLGGLPKTETRDLAARFDVPFRFLVDPGGRATRQLGIPGYHPDTVLPTAVVTDADGRILLADQTDNYRVRPEPETFLAALDRTVEPQGRR